MNSNDYLSKVESQFSEKNNVVISSFNALQFYEEKFEVKWLATKLKIYSFVAYLPNITKQDIIDFSTGCLSKVLHEYKGLPRGIQNGVVSFNLLTSENIDVEAIIYAQARPKKHFAAFEMPIIYNLANNSIHYYKQTPLWGYIYYNFFREYIEKSFNI